MTKKFTYGVNDKGYRLGEAHQNAVLTDDQVELIRRLYEEGFLGYRSLVLMCLEQWGLTVSKSTIKSICKYERRCSTPDAYRTGYKDESGRVMPIKKQLMLTTANMTSFQPRLPRKPPNRR